MNKEEIKEEFIKTGRNMKVRNDSIKELAYTANTWSKPIPKPKFKKKIGGTIRYWEPINKVWMTPEEYNMTYDFINSMEQHKKERNE